MAETDDDYADDDSDYEDDDFSNYSGFERGSSGQSAKREKPEEPENDENDGCELSREAVVASPPDDSPGDSLARGEDETAKGSASEARGAPRGGEISEPAMTEPPDPEGDGGGPPPSPSDSSEEPPPPTKNRHKIPDEIDDATGEDALRRRIWEAGERLVREGEKNVSLALQLEDCRDELAEARSEADRFRRSLLLGINGGVTDARNYAHVPLGELLRLRLKEYDAADAAEAGSESGPSLDGTARSRGRSARASSRSEAGGGAGSGVGGLQKLERELASERQRNEALERRSLVLREKLDSASREARDVDALKKKIAQMVERSRTERELRGRAEREAGIANEKVEALSEHIEKLMIHLKHEAISKARALADQVRTRREAELLKARNQTMAKRNARKDRAIMELKEGAKILEDQLRLMDEKYMELRLKLDWTRTQTERTIKKKEEEARQLRAKFALVSEMMPEGDRKGGVPLLDEFEFGSLEKATMQSKGTTSNNGSRPKKGKKKGTKGAVMKSATYGAQPKSPRRNLPNQGIKSPRRNSPYQSTKSPRRNLPNQGIT